MKPPALLRLLDHYHRRSGLSYQGLAEELTARQGPTSRMVAYNRIRHGAGVRPDVLRAFCGIWSLSEGERRELFEAAGYLVILSEER